MGLFTNNKKPCPICGSGTPRLLATVIENKTPICSDCSAKVSMLHKKVSELSLEGLRAHLAMREENKKYLQNTFRPTKAVSIGWTKVNIDEAHKVFTIPLVMCGDTNNPPVFKFEELTSYELKEEYNVIERFARGDSSPTYLSTPYNSVFQSQNNNTDNKALENISRSFRLFLYLSNPCWDVVESDAGAATGNVFTFAREYGKHLEALRPVTTVLASIIGRVSGGAGESSVSSMAADIMKFKELLDAGIITKEEFDAKKKQILEI